MFFRRNICVDPHYVDYSDLEHGVCDVYSVPGRPSGSSRYCSLPWRAAKRASTRASGSRSLNSIGHPTRWGRPRRIEDRLLVDLREEMRVWSSSTWSETTPSLLESLPIPSLPRPSESSALFLKNVVRTWEAPSLSFTRVRMDGHHVSGSRRFLVRASTRAPEFGVSTDRGSGPVREYRPRPDREYRRRSLGHTNRVNVTGPRHARGYLAVTVLHTGK